MEKNKIFAALEREYKNKKLIKERDADFRLQKLTEENPEFAALLQNCRAAEITAAKKAAAGSDNKKELAALAKANAARDGWLSAHKISPSSLLPAFDCSLCNDSGIAGGKYCSCFLTKLNAKLTANGTPEQGNTFKTSGLSKIKNKDQSARLQKIYAVAKEFCDKFPSVAKKNMALIGKTGTGKTYLLSAMVNELEEKGFNVFYLSAFALNNLFLKYHTTFDEDKMLYFDSLLNCDILAIDDLGTEPVYKNVTIEYLYSLINERNKGNKCTIYSTNLNPDEVKSTYTERVCSRMFDKDKTIVIEFTGGDLRINRED